MDKLLTFIIGVIFIGLLSALLCIPLAWAWNGTMPYLFGLKEIGLLQAFQLSLLSSFLVKSSLSASND